MVGIGGSPEPTAHFVIETQIISTIEVASQRRSNSIIKVRQQIPVRCTNSGASIADRVLEDIAGFQRYPHRPQTESRTRKRLVFRRRLRMRTQPGKSFRHRIAVLPGKSGRWAGVHVCEE